MLHRVEQNTECFQVLEIQAIALVSQIISCMCFVPLMMSFPFKTFLSNLNLKMSRLERTCPSDYRLISYTCMMYHRFDCSSSGHDATLLFSIAACAETVKTIVAKDRMVGTGNQCRIAELLIMFMAL